METYIALLISVVKKWDKNSDKVLNCFLFTFLLLSSVYICCTYCTDKSTGKTENISIHIIIHVSFRVLKLTLPV
jgi:hypothetical protein